MIIELKILLSFIAVLAATFIFRMYYKHLHAAVMTKRFKRILFMAGKMHDKGLIRITHEIVDNGYKINIYTASWYAIDRKTFNRLRWMVKAGEKYGVNAKIVELITAIDKRKRDREEMLKAIFGINGDINE